MTQNIIGDLDESKVWGQLYWWNEYIYIYIYIQKTNSLKKIIKKNDCTLDQCAIDFIQNSLFFFT
jgi:hypothetical protein